MNCREFWETLPETSVEHAHLAGCAPCRARMERQQELARGLRATAVSLRHLAAPSRTEARLLAAFREHSGAAQPRPRRGWIPAAAWGAAIAAMIAIGVTVVRERQPEARESAPSRAVELVSTDGNAQTGSALDAAVEDGFLMLPGAAQLSPAGDLNLVRVELPRSAMMQVGIEVSPERSAETVEAEVMVGSDGLARAVRFADTAASD